MAPNKSKRNLCVAFLHNGVTAMSKYATDHKDSRKRVCVAFPSKAFRMKSAIN